MTYIDITGSLTQEYLSTYRPYFAGIEKIRYYIHNAVSLLDKDTSTYSWTFWDGHAEIADKAFKDLDELIDLDFERTVDPGQAEIHLYRVSSTSQYVLDGTLGLVMPSTDGAPLPSAGNKRLFQNVFWASAPDDSSPFLIDEPGIDYGIARWQAAYTIIHEIGHSLGLSHPQLGSVDDPSGSWHSTDDTIMSYNSSVAYDQFGIKAFAPSWSEADVSTLLGIWGVENGDPITSFQGSASRLAGTAGQDKFVFNSSGDFGAAFADVVVGFNADQGDQLVLSRFAFPGLSGSIVRNVTSRRQLKKAFLSSSELIFHQPSGQLFYNENGLKRGLGSGGLFTVLEGVPYLQSENIQLA